MRWTLTQEADLHKAEHLQKAIGVSLPIAELLIKRGVETFEKAKTFFRPSLDDLHDPFLMKGMEKATSHILETLENHKPVMVFGDYDVDGTTSVALNDHLSQKSLGFDVVSYIPDRYDEGYGISYQGIDCAKSQGIDLIIALDCGIKSY